LLPAINLQHRSNLTDGQFRQESENRPVQREFSVDIVVSAIPSIRSVSFEHLQSPGHASLPLRTVIGLFWPRRDMAGFVFQRGPGLSFRSNRTTVEDNRERIVGESVSDSFCVFFSEVSPLHFGFWQLILENVGVQLLIESMEIGVSQTCSRRRQREVCTVTASSEKYEEFSEGPILRAKASPIRNPLDASKTYRAASASVAFATTCSICSAVTVGCFCFSTIGASMNSDSTCAEKLRLHSHPQRSQ
jgi:hypothetical protein